MQMQMSSDLSIIVLCSCLQKVFLVKRQNSVWYFYYCGKYFAEQFIEYFVKYFKQCIVQTFCVFIAQNLYYSIVLLKFCVCFAQRNSLLNNIKIYMNLFASMLLFSCDSISCTISRSGVKTLPEAQRTQGIEGQYQAPKARRCDSYLQSETIND